MEKTMISGFKEKTSHGNVLMPIQRYRCSYQELYLHWHEEVEITWIEEGSINYAINFEPFRLNKDDILLITPHTLHSARVDTEKGEEMISESLVFHLDLLGYQIPDACTMKYIGPLQKGKSRFVPVIRAGQPGHGELLECLKELLPHVDQRESAPFSRMDVDIPYAAFGRRDVDELYIKELLFRFFRLLYQYEYVVKNENTSNDSEMEKKLKTVIAFIQEHYTENMSIREIARVCHFSQAHFMNFFKRFAGMTCVEYINHYRLSRAAETLVTTDLPVMETALENGFHNISYFNKLFRREFGATPREYRRAAVGMGKEEGLKEN